MNFSQKKIDSKQESENMYHTHTQQNDSLSLEKNVESIESLKNDCTDNSLLFFPEKVSIISEANTGIFLVLRRFYDGITSVWPQ